MTFLSVAVCTWNRRATLTHCLDALLAHATAMEHEIVVVDNGSTDGTAELVSDLARGHPRLRLLREPTVGLSVARNAALREARGDLVAFIDDDALPGKGWMDAIGAAFAQHPAVGAVGGPVRLRWATAAPHWYSPELGSRYSALDLGPSPRALHFPEFPYGTNLAVRRALAVEIGGFSRHLGRQGSSLLSLEEGELCWRLEQAGHSVWWQPDMAVDHMVQPERAHVRFVIRRSFGDGRGSAMVAHLQGWPPTARIRQLVRASLAMPLRSLQSARRARRRGWHAAFVAAAATAAYYAGLVAEGAITPARRDEPSPPDHGRQ